MAPKHKSWLDVSMRWKTFWRTLALLIVDVGEACAALIIIMITLNTLGKNCRRSGCEKVTDRVKQILFYRSCQTFDQTRF